MKNCASRYSEGNLSWSAVSALLLALSYHLPAAAADVTVFVQTDFEPAQFEGLVSSPNGVITEKVNPAVTEVSPNYYAVTFSVDDKSPEEQTATAVALSKDGRMAVGAVVPAIPKGTPENCSPSAIDPVKIEVDAGTIRSLAANRLKRREYNRKILELSYTQFPSSEMESVERKFGLLYPDQVTRDLNPFQMVDRISRLIAALDSWNFRKSSSLPEQAGEEPTSSMPNEGTKPSSNG